MSDLLEQFIASRSYSLAAAKQRRSIIRRFLDVVPDPITATPGDVIDWWATTGHLSAASRRASHQAVQQFMSWLVAMDLRVKDPTIVIRSPVVHRAPPKVLTPDQVATLRASLDSDEKRLIFGLMLDRAERLAVGEWIDRFVDIASDRLISRINRQLRGDD